METERRVRLNKIIQFYISLIFIFTLFIEWESMKQGEATRQFDEYFRMADFIEAFILIRFSSTKPSSEKAIIKKTKVNKLRRSFDGNFQRKSWHHDSELKKKIISMISFYSQLWIQIKDRTGNFSLYFLSSRSPFFSASMHFSWFFTRFCLFFCCFIGHWPIT